MLIFEDLVFKKKNLITGKSRDGCRNRGISRLHKPVFEIDEIK
jgi:hypothetical protein